jgi:hypothetical protein
MAFVRLTYSNFTNWLSIPIIAGALLAALWITMARSAVQAIPAAGLPDQTLATAPIASDGQQQTPAITPTHVAAPVPGSGRQLRAVEPGPALLVTKTVGLIRNVCADTSAVTVTAGTQVFYCYNVLNTGSITLSRQTVVDDQLGTLLKDYELILSPQVSSRSEASATLPEALFYIPKVVNASVTNVVTWTGFTTDGLTAVDTDSATVNVVTIAVTKTVGLQPDACAATDVITVTQGTAVYYCYEVANQSATQLVRHTVIDSAVGVVLNDLNRPLAPGERFNTISAGYVVSDTADTTASNVVTWTAYTVGGLAPRATDATTVRVPSIAVEKTVGTQANGCAAESDITVVSGSEVYYCYRAHNTGGVIFRLHTVVDSAQGLLLDNESFPLAPGTSVFFTTTQRITAPVTSEVTWTASSHADPAMGAAAAFTATGRSSTTVTTIPAAAFTAIVFVDSDGNGLQRDVEPGLPGAVVTLQPANAEVIDGTTGPNGRVQFNGLAPGVYTVTVEAMWPGGAAEATTPNTPLRVELAAGESKNESFGFKIWEQLLLPLVVN